MAVAYDKYYQEENLFGNAYPELLDFFDQLKTKGKLLDVGCGQGRNAIPLAQLGFDVCGIDHSHVGIEQMQASAKLMGVNLISEVTDIYRYNHFDQFDIILFDSMFHFMKNDRLKELGLVQQVAISLKVNGILVFCIQDVGTKVETLKSGLCEVNLCEWKADVSFKYQWGTKNSSHSSMTDYRLIAVQKKIKYEGDTKK